MLGGGTKLLGLHAKGMQTELRGKVEARAPRAENGCVDILC